MNRMGVNKCLSREFDALWEKRGPGVEDARIPEGAKAEVTSIFNLVWALSSYGWQTIEYQVRTRGQRCEE